jgi:hypothetical protein
VINVRMTQNGRRQFRRIEGEVAIALDGFPARPLIQPALQKNLLVIHFDEEHRPRRGSRGPEKLDSHGA